MNDRLNDPLRFTPIKCPTCSGYGTVSNERRICHGCRGRGFVVIDQQTGLPMPLPAEGEKYDRVG